MEVNYNMKATAEAIRHSVKYLYLPTGSEKSGWFDVYDKGSDFGDQDGVNQKTNFEDVTLVSVYQTHPLNTKQLL